MEDALKSVLCPATGRWDEHIDRSPEAASQTGTAQPVSREKWETSSTPASRVSVKDIMNRWSGAPADRYRAKGSKLIKNIDIYHFKARSLIAGVMHAREREHDD